MKVNKFESQFEMIFHIFAAASLNKELDVKSEEKYKNLCLKYSDNNEIVKFMLDKFFDNNGNIKKDIADYFEMMHCPIDDNIESYICNYDYEYAFVCARMAVEEKRGFYFDIDELETF